MAWGMGVGVDRVRKHTLNGLTSTSQLLLLPQMSKPCNSIPSVGGGGVKPPRCGLCARWQLGGGHGMSVGHAIIVMAWYHCMNGRLWGHM